MSETNRLRRAVRHVALLLVSFVFAHAAYAVPQAGLEWTGSETTVDGPGWWTLGYQFTADSAITVTSLGAYDNAGDGLNISHDVGLWTAGGILLASATVPSGTGATLDGHFRYVDITDITLDAGSQYIVAAAAFGTFDGGDLYASVPLEMLLEPPDITFLMDRHELTQQSSALVFPTLSNYGGSTGAWFGGSLQLVPEPSTALLLVSGLVGFAISGRWRGKGRG